jgi:hypothetical protein
MVGVDLPEDCDAGRADGDPQGLDLVLELPVRVALVGAELRLLLVPLSFQRKQARLQALVAADLAGRLVQGVVNDRTEGGQVLQNGGILEELANKSGSGNQHLAS